MSKNPDAELYILCLQHLLQRMLSTITCLNDLINNFGEQVVQSLLFFVNKTTERWRKEEDMYVDQLKAKIQGRGWNCPVIIYDIKQNSQEEIKIL